MHSSHSISTAKGSVGSKGKWPCGFIEIKRSLVHLCFPPVDFRNWSLNPEGGSAAFVFSLTVEQSCSHVALSAEFWKFEFERPLL